MLDSNKDGKIQFKEWQNICDIAGKFIEDNIAENLRTSDIVSEKTEEVYKQEHLVVNKSYLFFAKLC